MPVSARLQGEEVSRWPHVINARLSDETKDAIDALAVRTKRRRSEVVRDAIDEYVERHGKPRKSTHHR